MVVTIKIPNCFNHYDNTNEDNTDACCYELLW